MKLIVNTIGGGIFSLYHQAIEPILEYCINNKDTNISSYKIIINDSHYIKNKNLFDDFFDYTTDSDLDNTQLYCIQPNKFFLKIHESPHYNKIKEIVTFNKINPYILNKVTKYVNEFMINENTLGIHIRLTDMNIHHASDHGIFNFNTYTNKIDNILEEHSNIDNMFICSDNEESIIKIKELYGDKYKINYITDAFRVKKENDDNFTFQIDMVNTVDTFHIKIFIEMLVAAHSKYFIYRVSDVSNFILAYSKTITNIYSIN
jgi:hypothetical protein